MSCWDGFVPAPPDEDHEAWHESDDEDEAWKAEGMADAEDWTPTVGVTAGRPRRRSNCSGKNWSRIRRTGRE